MQWPIPDAAYAACAVCAGGYGAAVGPLLPRPVYRLAVPSQERWREACPHGHALTGGPARGWLGRARCAECRGGGGAEGGPGEDGGGDGGGDRGAEEGGGDGCGRGRCGGEADGRRTGADGRLAPSAGQGRVRPETYGPRTGLLVLASALLCAGLALCVGPRPELAVWLLAAPFGLVLGAVDARVRRLPNVLTLPLAAGLAALLGAVAALPGAGGSWAGALLGGAALAGLYLLLFVLHPRGLGFGDVKLALSLGIALGWYGWGVLWAGAFLGTLLASGYGIALLVGRRAGWRTQVPFGPFMLLGALAGVLLGGLTA